MSDTSRAPALKRFQSILVPLVLVLLTLLFFYRLALSDLILARGDTYTYFYPYWHARNAALLSLQLPLWSADLFMGVPLLGNSQLGTFYPPNWVVAPLAPPDGVRLSILVHIAWAGVGTFLLAKRTAHVNSLSAFSAAVLFAFGGHVIGHVEQINQLQGLAWLPWMIYLLDRALARPLPNALLLGMALALQFFSGHTQTVFISGVALGIYALCTNPKRGLLTLAAAGGLALILALPQLLPTLELARLSNRSGGLSTNQAGAFSFSPFVTGRGLLPSYDTPIFAEYVAYVGVIGLGLALVGALSGGLRPKVRGIQLPLSPRATWIMMTLVGLALAYGLYNPLYWVLASLPGFNLFRVPARWLALFTLGAAMLAALGVERMLSSRAQGTPMETYAAPLPVRGVFRRSRFWLIPLIIFALAGASALTLRNNDGTPVSLPTLITVVGWGAGLVVLLVGAWKRMPTLLVGAVAIELWLASQVMPFNQLVPPDSYSAQRFTISQLLAYKEAAPAPMGRTLSISNLLFDAGDRATLNERFAALGMSAEATATAFDTVKLREVLGANLPLVWGIASADGFDGGLLPTRYYSEFTSLLLPDGAEPTVDGRLREVLALEACGGACIPDARWLALMGIEYLVTDKNYDLVDGGIFFDTQFAMGNGAIYPNPQGFIANSAEILCNPCDNLRVFYGDAEAQATGERAQVSGYWRLRFTLAPVAGNVRLVAEEGAIVRAVTLVDTRTGDFQQLAPEPWTRVLSSDIKMYRNGVTLPRAFVVNGVAFVPDDAHALEQMRDAAFDPSVTAILYEEAPGEIGREESDQRGSSATITDYTDTRVALRVNANEAGWLVLTDAYYPGWTATVNGEPASVFRADVMFRAVGVPVGESEVVFEYRPAWLPLAPLIGGAAWLITLALTAMLWMRRAGVRDTN